MRIENNIAFIENKLLHDAIWGDTDCIYNKKIKFTGYVQSNADLVGRAFIEYCIARVLNIYRLPKCGYDNYIYGSNIYNTLDEKQVEEACNELQNVINHVQEQLNKSEIVKDGKVTVVRCLASFQVPIVAEQLRDKRLKEIEFPVSIFSSYSYDGNINQSYPSTIKDYTKHINIKEDVKVEDIILWDKYVGDGLKECSYMKSMYDEEKELWVVDRSITGVKKLPVSSFYYKDGLPSDSKPFRREYSYGRNYAVHTGMQQKRPCEIDDFLSRIWLKRNLKKLEDEEI